MKIFFDTEFLEDGKTIDLLSIGMVAEDGRELHCIDMDARNRIVAKNPPWLMKHVIPKLFDGPYHLMRREEIRAAVLEFVGKDRPSFWASYASYDWVAFCQLFGKMLDLPDHWPKYVNDLKQLSNMAGSPDWPEQEYETEHNALFDARHALKVYKFLCAEILK